MNLTKIFAARFTNYDNPASLGSRIRARRVGPLLKLIENAYAKHGEAKVIDVGGTVRFWHAISDDFLKRHNVKVTLVNRAGEYSHFSDGIFEAEVGDGCNLDYADDSFHIAHSNSVIEHVGSWDRVMAFAAEIQRVAPHYFVQTPNFWFPIEPHFMTPGFQWLPRPSRAWLLQHLSLGSWPRAKSFQEALEWVDTCRLLTTAQMRQCFPDAEIILEWALGMPKSIIAVKGINSN
jgi:hypothetical protein